MPKIGVVVHKELRKTIFSEADCARLERLGAVRWTDSDKPIDTPAAIALLQDCEIGIGSWNTPRPDETLLPACPRLRLWVHAAGTVKHFFGPHLENRDLSICSCAPAIAECVAEITLGQLIVGLKRVIENDAANRKGRAPKPANSLTLACSTIGVIGASHVGRNVLRYLQPFRPSILLYDPFVSAEEARVLGAEKCDDLVDLCRRSHAVTLHAPNLPETRKMLDARHFQAMRDDGVLVNTARGDCIDEEALIGELQKGRLFAFLDVSSPEPAADNSPLRKLPNVIYTSHMAGGPDSRIGRQAVDDVAAFLQGKRPKMQVTVDMLARLA